MKKKKNKFLKTGVGLIGASVITGSIPNISGTATEAGLKTNLSTGLSNVGTALPVMGRVQGAGMVMGSIGGLQKAHEKFRLKKRKGRR